MKYLSRLFKLPIEYYVVFFLFLVIIGMSVNGNNGSYKGVGGASTLNMYDYENFQNQFAGSVHSAANVCGEEKNALKDTKGVLGIFEAEGLKAAPVESASLSDPVSKLKGSPECVGQSYGHSNSLGGLCFTEEVKKQFLTRGGNQASGQSQIGA